MISESSAWWPSHGTGIRVQPASPGISSNSCVRSGAVTSYTAPSSLLMMSCSVRVNLTNDSGFRHTMVSAIASFPLFIIPASVQHVGRPHIRCGNHYAIRKLTKIGHLAENKNWRDSPIDEFWQNLLLKSIEDRVRRRGLAVAGRICSLEAILVDLQ